MYKIFYLEFDNYEPVDFTSLPDAIDYAKEVGLECRFVKNGEVLGNWSVLRGLNLSFLG